MEIFFKDYENKVPLHIMLGYLPDSEIQYNYDMENVLASAHIWKRSDERLDF